MPIAKLTSTIARQVIELEAQDRTLTEIAQILNLKEIQVAAILAHNQLANTGHPEDREVSREASLPVVPTEEEKPEQQSVSPPLGTTLKHRDEEEEEIDDNRIYVGDDVDYSEPQYWTPANAEKVPNPHLMIVGESGSGKTYAMQCLVAELAQRGIPSIVFDYAQGFEKQNLETLLSKLAEDPARRC